jgi:hypothetical protein
MDNVQQVKTNSQKKLSDFLFILWAGGAFLICCEMSDPTNEVWTSRVEGMVVYSDDQLKTILVNAGFTNIAMYRRRKEELCIIGHKKMMQL